MKIWISSIALSLVASLPWSVAAADHVKSLQFGGRYSERELARLFPGAKCRAHGQSDQSICTIPTTLLGRPTVAEAFRDKQDRLIDFTAFLPEADELDVTRVLTERFGQPETQQSGAAVVQIWRQAGSPTLKVESAVRNGELRINFYSRALAVNESPGLDPSDL